MGTMRYLSREGDTKHNWDPSKKEQVAAAEELFNTLTKKQKYTAFYVDEKGNKSNKMKRFDKNASLMLLIPPIMGG